VLVVDDNATSRNLLQQQVTGWGVVCDTAEDGASGLAKLRAAAAERPYDLVILDRHMPGIDGLEVARAMRRDPTFDATHLMLLGSVGDGLAEARAADVEICLTKPVRATQLRQHLLALVTGGTRTETPPTVPTAPPLAVPRRERLVLIVEDNTVNQKVAVRLVERLGYRADVVANGLEALEALERISYDAVLMDCQMPEMDGYEATAEIRRREAGRGGHIAVIAMTANAMEGDRQRCLRAGMDDYIAKPVRFEALEKTLGRWITPSDALAAAHSRPQ
jgi:CheY-like chemotaxis protein